MSRAPTTAGGREHGGREDGGATLLLLSSLAAAALAVTLVAAMTGVAVGHARAAAAADLAALAGAAYFSAGHGAAAGCARAADIGARNGATVTSCAAEGESLLVTVAVSLVVVGVRAPVAATARAGPAEASEAVAVP